MSFILDALKKSETERQRQSVPGLMDAGTPPPRAIPLWGIALACLLGINLAILVAVLLRHDASAPSATRPPAMAPAPAAAAKPVPHFSPLDSAPVYAPEIPVAGDGTDSDAAPVRALPRTDRPSPTGAARRADLDHTEPVLSASGGDSDNDEVLPSISELNLNGAQGLPELHLDVHVFGTNAADRFVYINMRKYREGAVLEEGPRLERIRRDGVVLNYQGLRFVLPRQ